MLLVLRDNNIKTNNIQFGEKTENNIIKDSLFYPIYYINEHITLTSIVISFNLQNCEITTHFNKLKVGYNYDKNKVALKPIIDIEEMILNKFKKHIDKKYPVYKLSEIVKSSFIKGYFENVKYNDENCKLFVKISGIWVNNDSYGLNYKFLS
jgi:hypothetical protein